MSIVVRKYGDSSGAEVEDAGIIGGVRRIDGRILAKERDPVRLRDVWEGWHLIGRA